MVFPLCHKLQLWNRGENKQWGLTNVLYAILCILADKAPLTCYQLTWLLPSELPQTCSLSGCFIDCIYCCMRPSWHKDCLHATDTPWIHHRLYGLLLFVVYCHLHKEFPFRAFRCLENMTSQWTTEIAKHL